MTELVLRLDKGFLDELGVRLLADRLRGVLKPPNAAVVLDVEDGARGCSIELDRPRVVRVGNFDFFTAEVGA